MKQKEFLEKLFKLLKSQYKIFNINSGLEDISNELNIKKISDIFLFSKFRKTIINYIGYKTLNDGEIRNLYKEALSINYHMAINYLNTYFNNKDPESRHAAFICLFNNHPDDLISRINYLSAEEIFETYFKYNDYYFKKFKNHNFLLYQYCFYISQKGLLTHQDKGKLVNILIKKNNTEVLKCVRNFKASDDDKINELIDSHLIADKLSLN